LTTQHAPGRGAVGRSRVTLPDDAVAVGPGRDESPKRTSRGGATGSADARTGGSSGIPARLLASARWPLELEDPAPPWAPRDAWSGIVRRSIDAYRMGLAEEALQYWVPEITWRLPGSGPLSGLHRGGAAIFQLHARARRLTRDTFRQRLVALEGGGPVVTAYLRTEGRRGDRVLDIPSLVSFEVNGGRICRVTELPGDLDAWNAFWA